VIPLLIAGLVTLSGVTTYDRATIATVSPATATLSVAKKNIGAATTSIARVPFYSQFKDITSSKWQKVGCGIADLTMIVDFYKPGATTVNNLLQQGIAAGAYDYNAGWIYAGLIGLSKKYGLDGAYYDLTKLGAKAAYARLEGELAKGPVIASVHYKFDPASTIPHLVVLNGIKDGQVYYNDPAASAGGRVISKAAFQRAWKQKIIAIRPVSTHTDLAANQ
jgi:ABC-type bacteriocin/lantibiotic exporter with double-glycine peptidase domain